MLHNIIIQHIFINGLSLTLKIIDLYLCTLLLYIYFFILAPASTKPAGYEIVKYGDNCNNSGGATCLLLLLL